MQLYDFTDYKDFLKALFESSKEHGFKSSVAESLGTPSSFLSQVLHREVHFSQDHAYKLAQFLNLRESETEYLILLVSLARCASLEYRKHLMKKIEKLRSDAKVLSKRFENKSEVENLRHQILYYTTVEYSMVHLLLGIEEYQSVDKLEQRMQLDHQTLNKILSDLEEMDLVERKDVAKWQRKAGSVHLPKESPLSALNHTLWRDLAKRKIISKGETSFHYSAQHTLSKSDYEKIRGLVLELIDKSRDVVSKSGDEELIALQVDLFPV